MENNKPLRPSGAVGIYIIKNGAILLLLRNGVHAPGTWSPPGGHIEFGESVFDAARRELIEETGLILESMEIVGITSDVFSAEQKHSLTVHVRATAYSGTPRIVETDTFADMQWFNLSALPENLFLSNKNFLHQNPICLCGSGKKYLECHGITKE